MSAFLAQPVTLVEPLLGSRTQAAIVTKVWNDEFVNLTVFPEADVPYALGSVKFCGISEFTPDDPNQAYCTPAGWE